MHEPILRYENLAPPLQRFQPSLQRRVPLLGAGEPGSTPQPQRMLSLEPFTEDQGRSAVQPRGDPANYLPCALRVYSPVDSHTCQTPWSVFQDGPNGEPTGRRPERAGAEARQRARAAFHNRNDDVSAGLSTARAWATVAIRVGRRPESIGGPASPFHIRPGRIAGPIRFPPDNYKHSLTLFSKSFSSFPRGTCSLSVSCQYLALDGIYCPIRAAFPNNPTRRQRLVVRQDPGTTGLSPSLAPPSMGLGPGPPLRTLLQTTIHYVPNYIPVENFSNLPPPLSSSSLSFCSYSIRGCLLTSPCHQWHQIQTLASPRKSFTGNPFSKPSLVANPTSSRSVFPDTPANSPSGKETVLRAEKVGGLCGTLMTKKKWERSDIEAREGSITSCLLEGLKEFHVSDHLCFLH
ncbi:hypothetical protein DS421_15g502410 [Arachis hypogaea]|nr:hypothetical protein DS421_15g502410 [Arachis hypogaea]